MKAVDNRTRLRAPPKEVKTEDEEKEVLRLAREIKGADGRVVSLSGPEVGLPLTAVVLWAVDGSEHVLSNPRIAESSGHRPRRIHAHYTRGEEFWILAPSRLSVEHGIEERLSWAFLDRDALAVWHSVNVLEGRLLGDRGYGRRLGDPSPAPIEPRATGTLGRNDPCPCGSGRKWKRCHMPRGLGESHGR